MLDSGFRTSSSLIVDCGNQTVHCLRKWST